jgi:hypothetical protein
VAKAASLVPTPPASKTPSFSRASLKHVPIAELAGEANTSGNLAAAPVTAASVFSAASVSAAPTPSPSVSVGATPEPVAVSEDGGSKRASARDDRYDVLDRMIR